MTTRRQCKTCSNWIGIPKVGMMQEKEELSDEYVVTMGEDDSLNPNEVRLRSEGILVGTIFGMCLLNPPVPTFVHDGRLLHLWPETAAESVCSHWKSKALWT